MCIRDRVWQGPKEIGKCYLSQYLNMQICQICKYFASPEKFKTSSWRMLLESVAKFSRFIAHQRNGSETLLMYGIWNTLCFQGIWQLEEKIFTFTWSHIYNKVHSLYEITSLNLTCKPSKAKFGMQFLSNGKAFYSKQSAFFGTLSFYLR